MTTMLDCITEQPAICETILRDEAHSFGDLDRLLDGRTVTRVLVLATGSSMNAVRATERHFAAVAGVSTVTIEPYTFSEYETIDTAFDLVVAVSQRGTSTSTIDAVAAARARIDAPIVAVTGDVHSPLTEHVDASVDIRCGDEAVRYSTKGVTSTVLTLLLLSVRLAERQGRMVEPRDGREGMAAAVAQLPRIIEDAERYYAENAAELDAVSRISVLSYGPNIGTAVEAETKIIETVRVPVQGMELEAYMHGPLFELKRDYTLFLTEVPGVSSAARLRQFAEFASRYCDFVHIVTLGAPTGWPRELALDLDVAEVLSPLALIPVYQVFAYRMSVAKGIDLVAPAFPDFRSAMRTKVAG
jgi:glucoselysine-6-phosphate deglycase